MGREVRRVPKDWEHPVEGGQYKPLYAGEMPDPHYTDSTYYQMYETTSEGTPISPVMDRPENLASWLVENKATAFAGQTASYEAWLMVCQGRTALSGVYIGGDFMNGVEHQAKQSVSQSRKGYGPSQ